MNATIPEQLIRPIYSFSEADHLAGATKGTTRRWTTGYSYVRRGKRIEQPAVTRGTRVPGGASFLDLIEVVAIARLKNVGFSLREVRTVVRNCEELLGVERPLGRLKFKTGGREIFVAAGPALLEVGRRKHMTAWNEILEPFLEELDYSADWVERWWPLGKGSLVVVDPDYAFGLPVIAGSGVRTEIVLERFKAGELPDEIAQDFNVTPLEVERAIQFEVTRAA